MKIFRRIFRINTGQDSIEEEKSSCEQTEGETSNYDRNSFAPGAVSIANLYIRYAIRWNGAQLLRTIKPNQISNHLI